MEPVYCPECHFVTAARVNYDAGGFDYPPSIEINDANDSDQCPRCGTYYEIGEMPDSA